MQTAATCHFSFKGNLSGRKALEVKQALAGMIDKGNHCLIVDLTSVCDADIAGVNALALTYKKLRDVGGKMEIRLHREGQLARMLHITRFDLLLTIKFVQLS
ncbi:STAS domain-containing protein [Foetidibacter luteolus]|uniref:STAS domain-containing protein n=1 Tax=Foetidibacter luteolus TaxID=2608880 RepID=UPI00129A3DB7|nr:STAS domain-containing protein [Foetidibacter luteolus]